MIQKPEKFTILFYGLSVALTALAIANCIAMDVPDLHDIVLPALLFMALLATAEMLTGRLGRFIAIMLVHLLVASAAILSIRFTYPFISVLIICSMILIMSPRLPSRFSILLSATLVLFPVLTGVLDRVPALEVAMPGLIEASVACLCVILVRYREALVRHSSRLEEEHRSLVNLLAANESFIQKLPEIREESAEGERLRITRELHDSLGYSMTSISMIMKAAQYLIPANPEKVREYCRKANELALETMNETRETLYKLRAIERATPRQPDAFFLRMCRNFQEATGVVTECHPGNLNEMLPERVFQALFRTVQVGFINALRHGRASRIHLLFWVRSDGLTMTIRNNIENADFDDEQPAEGIGLKGVRERIGDLEGEIRMVRSLGEFTLTVLIPEKELHDRDDLRDSG